MLQVKMNLLCVATLLGCAWRTTLAETCSWCTGGACVPDCPAELRRLHVPWLEAGTGGLVVPYWQSSQQPVLGDFSAEYEYGYVTHHGDGRNGETYLCGAYNGVLERFGAAAGAKKVLVIAPQVYEKIDDRPADVIYWDEQDDKLPARKWNWGGNSSSDFNTSISSFDTLDIFLRIMSNKQVYPNIRRIFVAGHSSGGQIVQRYALASTLDGTLGVPVEYFVANPSSYTYLDGKRPVLPALESEGCLFCVNKSIAGATYTFQEPEEAASKCPGYNDYGFGLLGTLVPYYTTSSSAPLLRLKELYGDKSVNYVSGESDVCNRPWMESHSCTSCDPDDGGFETTCGDMLQGHCRMERAHAFAQAIKLYYKGHARSHRLLSVPGVGHNGCAIFQSPEVLGVMFPADVQSNVVVA
mmetsp:Transcript_66141/g.158216  ORF Transcript_66141/g.158216 Transcript_66141/m.158216 type:complete len:411 (+) Transcript_66141:74-1306(+)